MGGQDGRIGRVVSVSGGQVVILVDGEDGAGDANGRTILQMGSLVKMLTPDSTVYGMVSGLSIPIPSQDPDAREMKIAELETIGEVVNPANGEDVSFKRGVSVFPGLGDVVYAASQDDLGQVYARPSVPTLRIGTIHQDPTLPGYLVTDDLLGKHFAILGTTGSGKSCVVALILHEILAQNANAHVVVLDPHNEYAHAFGDKAEVVDPDNLQLPYWLLNLEEIVEVVLGTEGNVSQSDAAILSELIRQGKKLHAGNAEGAEVLTVDTPIPYKLSEVNRLIDEAMGKLMGKSEAIAPYQRIKARLNTLQADQRFAFMFGGLTVQDNMTKILSRLFRIPVDGKPITIVNLSGVPSEVLNVVVSVLCRMSFDMVLWSDRALPMLLVCEEAHRYAPHDTEVGFEPAKRALSRIAKEGRKYGLSLCVVSQRPAALATDILSQCNTLFALRMSSKKDQDFVQGTMSETTAGLFESLPSLRNAEAIVVGEGIAVPMRMCFDELPEDKRPLSGSSAFSAAWQEDNNSSEAFLEQITARWRRQSL